MGRAAKINVSILCRILLVAHVVWYRIVYKFTPLFDAKYLTNGAPKPTYNVLVRGGGQRLGVKM